MSGGGLIGCNVVAMGTAASGRRWQAVAWFDSVEVGDGLDRVRMMCSGSICSQVMDRANEYRFVWDGDKSMWRLDRRVHVAGS